MLCENVKAEITLQPKKKKKFNSPERFLKNILVI